MIYSLLFFIFIGSNLGFYFWVVQDPIHHRLSILWRLLNWLLISQWHQLKNSIRSICLNICEVIILFMFTCLSLLWLPPAEFYGCDISCRSWFMLLLVQSRGLLWKIIHGVMQLAFSAIRKQMSIQNHLCAHVANIMI